MPHINQMTYTSCPGCQSKGRKVDTSTLKALLRQDANRRLTDGFYRFCRDASCEVVYFDEAHHLIFDVKDLSVPVFQKSTDPNRPVCYCFGHTVQRIQDEVAEQGASDIPESIGAQCKEGLDDCKHNNPQGSCCLGNVRMVVKTEIEARGGFQEPPTRTSGGCVSCEEINSEADDVNIPLVEEHAHGAPRSTKVRMDMDGSSTIIRAGLLSSGGAVVGALLASACCWLPLVLIGMGVSTLGVAGFFEAYRPHILVATVTLLGVGFYVVYVRKPKCAPGDACEVPSQSLQRINKVSLWIATVLVGVFATFPNYVGVFFGEDGLGTATLAQTPSDGSRTYIIEGMTCEGCTGHIRAVVGRLPNVKAVEVSYAKSSATVVFEGGTFDDQEVYQAVKSIGYTAHVSAKSASQ